MSERPQPVRSLPPGGTVGILGGGQLGRMLAMAAARLGFRSHIYCPDADRPAADVAAACRAAPYEDEASLAAFAAAVSVVTYEFENVPEATARYLAARVPVWPPPVALAVAQDRLREKSFLTDAGVDTAPFAAIDAAADLPAALRAVGLPAVIKTRRFGYDGKGQAYVADAAQAAEALAALGGGGVLIEGFVTFAREISVIVARGADGAARCYEPVWNVHENHVLARSIVPSGIPAAVAEAAKDIALRIAERLDYVGVMGIEMFLATGDSGPRLFVNEMAPRVHNSGHWTLDACVVSQFEQHIRAICGWPLGTVERHSDAVMANLLGDAVDGWAELAQRPDVAVHIYGKSGAAPGRKMGHVTRLYPRGSNPCTSPLQP
ncbi:MAG: 5-(carboxyamino)imidazole ribonucleotide synthase [Rhodospirillales bacterium]|nr:5-(carboxyamino)imidazole ribonucleotide synthase [Rhodospirillales bacterium]